MNMKAVVLGGAGVMGSYAVEVLSRGNVFSEICVADVNEERGRRVCEGTERTEFVNVDVTDGRSLSNAIEDADVLVNCVGPFYKFAPMILKTAIQHGIDYVDICDDYDATLELLGMDEEAKKAGITCVVGLGASPGITNVIAAYASNLLSSVKEIKVYVTRGIKEEAGGAIPYHMLHCWLGEIPIYRNGEHTKARGLVDGKEWVTFPEPFGEASVYYFGHPETVTLPRYISGLEHVCCKGTFFPSQFRDILLQLQNLGLLSPEPIMVGNTRISPLDFLASYVGTMVGKMHNLPDIPEGGAVMVRVTGEKEGVPKEYLFSGIARMREATATPAAVGAEMIAKKEMAMPGVHAPEACVPPKEFLNRLLREEFFGDVWMGMTERVREL